MVGEFGVAVEEEKVRGANEWVGEGVCDSVPNVEMMRFPTKRSGEQASGIERVVHDFGLSDEEDETEEYANASYDTL